jgi:serine/threonine-protein kinase
VSFPPSRSGDASRSNQPTSTFEATITAKLEAAGVDGVELQRHPGATIHPPSASVSVRPPPEALAKLGGATLAIHDRLGEGGMGLVLSATQLRLGREVAVKTLRPEVVTDRAIGELVREAWVTGLLEHPHIIPVHDIELDAHGVPQIVLKRVEGDGWVRQVTWRKRTRCLDRHH